MDEFLSAMEDLKKFQACLQRKGDKFYDVRDNFVDATKALFFMKSRLNPDSRIV